MATAEELLSGDVTRDNTFIIDSDLRTIIIPRWVNNLGVESDDDVMRVEFQMPAEYCGIDLSTFKIRINYVNANNEPDFYEVTDAVKRADGVIRFSWLVGRHAAMYKGDVKFIVCLRDVNGSGVVLREFNTTIATLPILEGLETTEAASVEYADFFEEWRQALFGVSASAEQTIRQVGQIVRAEVEREAESIIAALPDDYTTAAEAANESVRTKADAIVQTARGRTLVLTDSSDDYLPGLRVFGETTQVITTGKNKVDMSGFEFDDSGYAHSIAPGTKSSDDLYAFLRANTGESIVVSMDRTGVPSGIEIGSIRFYGPGTTLLCAIVPYVEHVVPELPETYEVAYIYGSGNGASVKNIQVEFGTSATEYEPYSGGVAAPSPDFAMPLSSILGSNTVVTGKNLIPYPYSDTTNTVNGITYTDNGDGSITANGTATANAAFYFTNVGTGHYVDGTVCLSGCPAGGSASGSGYSLRLNKYVDGVEKSGLVDTGSGKSGTFNNDLARIYFVVLSGGTVKNLTIRPMLEYGDTPTEYEPSTTPSTVEYTWISQAYLEGLPVTSGGNYTDENGQQWLCDEVDYTRGVHVQRVAYKTLDETIPYQQAGTQIDGTYTAFVSFADVWINETDCFMADKFRCYNGAGYKTSSKEGIYTNPGTSNCNLVIVRVSNDKATDITSFVNFMAANPTRVLVPLAKPIETPLSQLMLNSFKPARTVYPCTSVKNLGGAFMEVSYNADTKTYITNTMTSVLEGIENGSY